MSRIAKNPVVVPAGVELKVDGAAVSALKVRMVQLSLDVHPSVEVAARQNAGMTFAPRDGSKAGTRSVWYILALWLTTWLLAVRRWFLLKLCCCKVLVTVHAAKGNTLNLFWVSLTQSITNCQKAFPQKLQTTLLLLSKVLISSALVRLLLRFALSVHQSLTKVRVFVTADEYVRRKEAKKK